MATRLRCSELASLEWTATCPCPLFTLAFSTLAPFLLWHFPSYSLFTLALSILPTFYTGNHFTLALLVQHNFCSSILNTSPFIDTEF